MLRRRSSSLCCDERGSGRYSSWMRDGLPPPSPLSSLRKPGGLRGPSTIKTSAAGSLLSHSDAVSTDPVEQAVESFVGLDCRDLWGGRLTSHCMFHPPLKPRPTGSLAVANSRERRHHRSRPILGRRLPKKDATYARAKVRRPSDGERLDVKGSFLKPSGIVGDENERAETDLATLS